jgi:hypothetical protein
VFFFSTFGKAAGQAVYGHFLGILDRQSVVIFLVVSGLRGADPVATRSPSFSTCQFMQTTQVVIFYTRRRGPDIKVSTVYFQVRHL